MHQTRSTNIRRYEKSRSARNEDHDAQSILRLKAEEKQQRRRREWQRQQERDRLHGKLNRQKILEYEKKRAQALQSAESKSLYHSRSKSNSKSPSQYRHRGISPSTSKSNTLFEKFDGSTSGTVPLFKGPEGIQISTTELRRITVDIRRNIPTKGPVPELQRSIVNAEDVILKRRMGEGDKPIFDREEIKDIKINEVEERRTVVAIDGEQSISTNKSHTGRKRSSSPVYNRSGYLSSHQTRTLMEDRSSKRSRERRDRNRDKERDRDRSRERREIPPHYIEPPIHVPIYYSLPPRPIVVSPMIPFRGHVPPVGRGRYSTPVAPIRPFQPRFITPDMYRLGPPPPNPRYGPF